MAIEYIGINYFPLLTGFFHCDKIELLTAIFGIKGPYAVIMLLCKIYTDGYYIPWGKEQCMIFARKLGPEYDKETMGDIVNMLVEKEFFDKESYEKYEILTSTEIQKVWMEATSRRKRDLAKLPYLLIECTDSKSNNKNNSKNSSEKNNENKGCSKGRFPYRRTGSVSETAHYVLEKRSQTKRRRKSHCDFHCEKRWSDNRCTSGTQCLSNAGCRSSPHHQQYAQMGTGRK